MNFDVSFYNFCSVKMIKVAFSVSQGSVATQLRCGGKHNKRFIANFLLNPTIKEFWKSANNCQSYE